MGNLVLTTAAQPLIWQALLDATLGTATIPIWNVNQQRCQVQEIYLANTDAIDHVVDLLVSDGGSPLFMGSVLVPAGSGTGTTPTVGMLNSIQGAGNGGIATDVFSNLILQNEIASTLAGSVYATALGQSF